MASFAGSGTAGWRIHPVVSGSGTSDHHEQPTAAVDRMSPIASSARQEESGFSGSAAGALHPRTKGVRHMYARSTSLQARVSSMDAGIQLIRDEVLPAVQAMQGCVGLSMMAD